MGLSAQKFGPSGIKKRAIENCERKFKIYSDEKKQKCNLDRSALLARLITTFQQNYRNYQLAVIPKEVGLYCRVPLNDPLPFLSGLSPVLGFS